jgi:hypothetical protein
MGKKKHKRIEAQRRDNNTLEGAKKHTMRSPKRRNQVTVGLKPIIGNTKQFMQGDGRET